MSEAKDPVCGKDVDPLRARAVGIFGGVTYYFCSQECKARFGDPRKAPREQGRDAPSKKESRKAAPPPEPRPEKRPREATDSLQFKSEPSAEALAAYEADGADAGERRSWTRIWSVIFVLMAAAGAVAFYLLRKG